MTRGVRPTIKASGEALAKVPPVPSYLGKAAKAEWRRVARILVARGILADADLATLGAYCSAVGVCQQCERAIAEQGVTVIGPKGLQRHPALGALATAQTNVRQLAGELGLTPTSRNRAGLQGEEADDDTSPLAVR